MTPRSATSPKRTSRKATAGKAPSRKAPSRRASGKSVSGKSVLRKAIVGKAIVAQAKRGTSRRRAAAADPASSGKGSRPGTERARDEQRDEPTPRYGGGPWSVADERGDARFGHARNDDAEPSELAPRDAEDGGDESPTAADPDLAATEPAGESGGQHAGMGRGEKPRKRRSRER
jgi:hypothetical protein